MTVRIDEKLKKIEKRKKQREKRAARKPAPVVAPPAPSEGLLPSAPGSRRTDARSTDARRARRPRLHPSQ